MSLKFQAGFGGGELDPALHERNNLNKYRTGLKTARNVIVAKSGRLISRPGRKIVAKTKTDNTAVKLFAALGCIVEWGNLYVRLYSLDAAKTFTAVGSLVDEFSHSLTTADLPNLRFEDDGTYLYVFYLGVAAGSPLKLWPVPSGAGGGFLPATIFNLPAAPTGETATTTSGTGYLVEYVYTRVVNGQESLTSVAQTEPVPGGGGSISIPINAGEVSELVVKMHAGTSDDGTQEMKVYRRPVKGNAYGFIGSSTKIYTAGGETRANFLDIGQAADYTHTPPSPVENWTARGGSNAYALLPIMGLIYQHRLLMVRYDGALFASRPDFLNNFYTDHPVGADSSLAMRISTNRGSTPLWMCESNGLIIFTSKGIFVNSGAMGPLNLAFSKLGRWVIDSNVPPLVIPGGVIFIDKKTNVVRNLGYSNELQKYSGEELSVYSDHLFARRSVNSWGFMEGETPLVWVAFNDGKFASLNYEPNQEMRAWTRHDSYAMVSEENTLLTTEQACETEYENVSAFITKKGTKRWIEVSVPRYATLEEIDDDPEAEMGESIAYMDSMKSYKTLLNDALDVGDAFVLVTTSPGVWDTYLQLTTSTSANFLVGDVGKTYRFFNPDTGEVTDLLITAYLNSNTLQVLPSNTFPSEFATASPRIYLVRTTFTGLAHLEGEQPAIIVDGYVVNSPNNPDLFDSSLVVSSGSITLANGGAIVHIGRAITGDIETLEPDTVEQRPVMIESKTANKIYIKTHESRGLFVGNEFPDEHSSTGMQPLDSWSTEDAIVSNRYPAPQTKRTEITIPGSWESNGRVCLRQVDPVHFEVLSIMVDLQDERR